MVFGDLAFYYHLTIRRNSDVYNRPSDFNGTGSQGGASLIASRPYRLFSCYWGDDHLIMQTALRHCCAAGRQLGCSARRQVISISLCRLYTVAWMSQVYHSPGYTLPLTAPVFLCSSRVLHLEAIAFEASLPLKQNCMQRCDMLSVAAQGMHADRFNP